MPDLPQQQCLLPGSTSANGTDLDSWVRLMKDTSPAAEGELLPPHSATCAGCGPDNPAGLGLRVENSAAGVRAVHRFDDRQTGAPGIAHGGLVAAAFDDLFGFLLYSVGQLAVTRSLTVEYLRPVRLHQDYVFTASINDRSGRRLHVAAQVDAPDGTVHGTAKATFVTVDHSHFSPPPAP